MDDRDTDALLVQLDQQLCFKLYAASRMMVKAYKPLLESMGVTYPQYLVLMVLWEERRPCTIGHLGEKLLLDTGTLTPLLKRMEMQKLLSRTRGLKDERQVWVEIAPLGESLQFQALAWVKQAGGRLGELDLDLVSLRAQLGVLLQAIK